MIMQLTLLNKPDNYCFSC